MNLYKPTKFLFIPLILFILSSNNAPAQIDSSAVAILDRMNFVLANLNSCSLVLTTEYDVFYDGLGLVKNSDEADIFLKGPDKLLVNKKGDKGQRDFFYDGKTLTVFSPGNNQYATIQAPPTIMEMVHNIHNNYGMDFPASDFFYPDFVDDLLASSINLSFLGTTMTEGKTCFHIAGTESDMTYQFWIADDNTFLPVKMVIVYTNMPGSPQYEALYENWSINPSLSDAMFNFTPPNGAKSIKLIKNIKN